MKILFFRQDTVNVIMNTVWGGCCAMLSSGQNMAVT